LIYDRISAHEQGAEVVLNYYQDVEPILDAAAAARREDRERTAFQKSSEFKRTMIVPFNVLMQIRTERGLDFLNPEHSKAIVKLLKTSEYAGFRTTNKKRR
jgi:hypothetical protein